MSVIGAIGNGIRPLPPLAPAPVAAAEPISAQPAPPHFAARQAEEIAAAAGVADPVADTLHLRQHVSEAPDAPRGLFDVITYERPLPDAPEPPVRLTEAEIIAAAAYNLVSASRAAGAGAWGPRKA